MDTDKNIELIKFAVVGCGHIGKRHAQTIGLHPEAELVALCDIVGEEKLNINEFELPFFEGIEAMLSSGVEVDVICICTPNGYHTEQCIQALEAGKHVVCEKPMGLRKSDCEQVIHKALTVGRQVFCVMQNRYSPPAVWLKELIEKKILGDIHTVQLNCYWNRDDRYYLNEGQQHAWHGTIQQDGGPLFTQFSHYVDLMYWLFGDIDAVQARFENFTHHHSTEFEDTGLVTFRFLKGGIGSLNYSTAIWGKNMETSITVTGSKGSVRVGGQYMDKVEYCHIADYEMPTLQAVNPANDYGTYKGSANNHGYVFENVIDVLKNRTTITTNALEGMKVVEIIERIYALRSANF